MGLGVLGSANVARSKNAKSHDLFNHLSKFDPFASQQELLLRTAYGYNTLGMPDSVLPRTSTTSMLECSNNSSWTTSLQESASLLPVVSRTTRNTLISSRRDSESC